MPAARPKTPCRFGPCLCAPPASIVWHWLHLRTARVWSLDRCALSSQPRRTSSVRAIAAPRPRLVLKIFAPLSPLPIGHCVASFLVIGGSDPQISAFILRAAVLEASLAVVSTCCVRTVSPCVALRCTNQPQKNGSKTRYSGDKTELRKEHRRFCQKRSKRPPPCARAIAHPAANRNAREDSFRPEERRLRREGAVVFSPCLLLVLPPTAQATRRGRRVCAFYVPLGRCRCAQFWVRVCSSACPANTSERP